MAIQCPLCQYSITVKNAKPGRYTPKCPKCASPFSLTVPSDPNDEWIADALLTPVVAAPPKAAPPPPAKRPATKPSLESTEMTGGFESSVPSPAPLIKQPPKRKIDHDATEATGGFQRSPAADFDETAAGEVSRGDDDPERTMDSDPSVKDDVEESRAGKLSYDDLEMPDKMGGYEVIKELGRGGMGAVFLARQISLDRSVALKVMNGRWASDPVFLARFTREAYAAAQLVHHNVVQIYDIGQEQGINFFSMEFVEGRSLGDMIKKDGKLNFEAAVGYIIQAARGLKFAHDRGMIHRDVKPDNLMLNSQGIVKVADLGLVKTPAMTRDDDEISADDNKPASKDGLGGRRSKTGLGSLPSGMTHAHTAMGSPAYMSPEQCRDAAGVDHRADIYSLGCTFYMMLIGHTPFKGSTAFEVMTKHATEPVVPPNQVLKIIPKEVSAIVVKSLEKDVKDRYQNLGEMIGDMEKWINAKAGGGSFPSEEQLETLENAVERFNGSSVAKVRRFLSKAFILGSLVGSLACAYFNQPAIAIGLLGMLVTCGFFYFVLSGLSGKSYLFRKTRETVFGIRFTDWLMLLFGTALFGLILYLTGLLWAWLGFGVLGVILAMGMKILIDKQAASQRQPWIDESEHMFKRLRLHGFDEDALRGFVAQNSGKHWEEFFEALFGFEAKLAARDALGEEARKRSRFAAWREPLIRWFDRIQLARKEARERKHFQIIEAKKLRAEGFDKAEAEEQAEAAAVQMVAQAAVIKAAEAPRRRADESNETVVHQVKPINIQKMLEEAEKPPKNLPKQPMQPLKHLFQFILGWKLRFVLAALMIAGGVLWLTKVTASEWESAAKAKNEAPKLADFQKAFVSQEKNLPLSIEYIPDVLTKWFDHINPLIAGLIMLIAVFSRKVVRTLLLLLAAAVTFGAHFAIPDKISPVEPYQLSMAVGVVLAVLAFVLTRKRKEV